MGKKAERLKVRILDTTELERIIHDPKSSRADIDAARCEYDNRRPLPHWNPAECQRRERKFLDDLKKEAKMKIIVPPKRVVNTESLPLFREDVEDLVAQAGGYIAISTLLNCLRGSNRGGMTPISEREWRIPEWEFPALLESFGFRRTKGKGHTTLVVARSNQSLA